MLGEIRASKKTLGMTKLLTPHGLSRLSISRRVIIDNFGVLVPTLGQELLQIHPYAVIVVLNAFRNTTI